MTTVQEQIKKYCEKEREIYKLEEEIRRIEKDILEPIKKTKKAKQQELDIIGQEPIIDISVGDLIKELSELSGIPENEIYVDVDYYGIWTSEDYSKDDFAKIEKKPQLKVTISNVSPNYTYVKNLKPDDFYYDLTFLSDYNELQADGKSLIDHSYTIRGEIDDNPYHRIKTSLYIKPYDVDVLNIICHLKLCDLATSLELRSRYYPKDLLGQALANYEIREAEKNKVKIKQ